jgi:hypothetical protein
MCTQYLHHTHLPMSFPHLLPPPTDNQALRQDLFPPVLSDFVNEKNDIFVYLRYLHRKFPCVCVCIYIYIYICIYII